MILAFVVLALVDSTFPVSSRLVADARTGAEHINKTFFQIIVVHSCFDLTGCFNFPIDPAGIVVASNHVFTCFLCFAQTTLIYILVRLLATSLVEELWTGCHYSTLL